MHPHPGNILVELPTATNGYASAKPVLLDFGLAKRLTDQTRLGFCKLVVASAQKDYFMLLEAFDEIGLKLNRNDAQSDMDIIRFLFRDTAPPTSARKLQKKFQKAVEAKIVPPVRAFPGNLLFFLRAQDLLRGLASKLEVVQSPLKIFYKIAKVALNESTACNDTMELRNMSIATFDRIRSINGKLTNDIERVLNQMIETNIITGCQCAITKDNVMIADIAVGYQDKRDPSRFVQPFSLFNSFSCTKAITATALHLLVDDGLITSYDDPVKKYWPKFGVLHPDMTISEILSHRSRMQHAMPKNITFEQFCDFDYMCTAMCDISQEIKSAEELENPSIGHYHYLSFGWLVGGLVHAVTGHSFQDFVRSRIFEPLHLDTEAVIGVDIKWLERDNINYARLATIDPSNMLGEEAVKEGVDNVNENELDQITNRIKARADRLKASLDDKKGNSSATDLLEDLRTKSFLFDMRVYNSKKVRHAIIPAANGHFSARAMAAFYASLASPPPLNPKIPSLLSDRTLANATQFTYSFVKADLNDDRGSDTEFGLGYTRFGFELRSGEIKHGFGHGGIGGSMGMSIPHVGLTIGLTVNLLQKNSIVLKQILSLLQTYFPNMGTPVFFTGDSN